MLSKHYLDISRDAQIGLEFAGVNFYDGQGFMVRKDSGISSAMELDGAVFVLTLERQRIKHG